MAARTAVNPPVTEVAPVTLIVGEEEFLVDRAVRDLITAARGPARWSIEPAIAGTMEHRAGEGGDSASLGDLHDLDGAALGPGELESLVSPSLFGGGCVLVVRSAQNVSKEVAAELARYAKNPAADVVLVLAHAGGAKGKELLASVKAARAARLHQGGIPPGGKASRRRRRPRAAGRGRLGSARARGRLQPACRRHRR